MKPILILQHLTSDGPAYLATWLQHRRLPFEVRNTEAGHAFPAHMDGHSALAVLGGEMSANDVLPSLRQAQTLILDAMARDKPVIGHCLGGQLMARALGAAIRPSPAPEVGWHAIDVRRHASAEAWFGDAGRLSVFQWHEEAFDLPPPATALAGNGNCAHQAFAIGPHLALQFHVEVDEEKLQRWSRLDTPALRASRQQHDTVHGGERMRAEMAMYLQAQKALADRIYAHWLASVRARAT